MAEEITKKAPKERTKTDMFKEHIQKIIYQSLGVKVSKEKAWNLFKDIMHGTEEFVTALDRDDKGRRLPLAGVGTFCILETKPRGSKAGLDKDGNPVEGAKVWDYVPRFRFYPSSVTDATIEQVLGLENHGLDIKHYGIFATEQAFVEKTTAADASVEEETVEDTAPTDEFDEFDEI